MLMFHDGRMGLASAGVCRAPLWPAPESHWFAPLRPAMTEVIEDVTSISPSSPQSDTDSSHSSVLSDYRSTYYSGYHVTSSVGQPESAVLPPCFPCRWRACTCSFSSLDALSSHVASSHADVTGGLFYCGWEGCTRGHRGFNARYKMLVHVRTHTNERPHKCTQCEKSFSRAENLKIHTRSHSGEKPYICPVQGCNKAYSNSSDRFKHTRTHSVDKPYCCKITGCQKRYTDPSSLRKHVKTYKHASVSPNLPEIDANEKKTNQNEIAVAQNNIQQLEARIFETGTTTVRPNTSLSESDSYEHNIKHFQRKYSYSESDRTVQVTGHAFKVEYSPTPLLFTDNSQDESNKLCFCKDLPCIHTSRYVNPEYISEDSLPYSCHIQSPKISFTTELSSSIEDEDRSERFFRNEPLNLKRTNDSCFEEIYENGALNLEKKAKTEFIDRAICLDSPLDLSKKTC